MPLSTQANQIALRKAANAVRAKGNGAIDQLFKGFKMGLNAENITGDLQLVQFANLTVDVVVADAACKVYAIYLKKQDNGTDAFYNVFDDATNDATAADAMISLGLLAGLDEVFWACPRGLAFGTGIVHGSYTALAGYNGTTATTTAQGPDGWILFGAA